MLLQNASQPAARAEARGGPVCLLLAGLLGLPAEARAYVDPGAGSILIQGLLGAIAVASALAVTYWRALRRFFGRFARPHRPKDE